MLSLENLTKSIHVEYNESRMTESRIIEKINESGVRLKGWMQKRLTGTQASKMMKTVKFALLSLLVTGLILPVSFAAGRYPYQDHKMRPAEMTADEILILQTRVAGLPLGQRIAYWAERFIGTSYDADPLGLYVNTKRIVADERVDCMYLTFRAAELAQANTPLRAVEKALSLRFLTQGKIVDGLVVNYDDRFEYGEDMVFSGKWGKNITTELGATQKITGPRGRDEVEILSKRTLTTKTFQKKLKDGDIIYWVKEPKKRVVEEIVGHLSIVRIRSGALQIIHAAGSKGQWAAPGNGKVQEVPFADYVRNTRFIGAFVTRFEQ